MTAFRLSVWLLVLKGVGAFGLERDAQTRARCLGKALEGRCGQGKGKQITITISEEHEAVLMAHEPDGDYLPEEMRDQTQCACRRPFFSWKTIARGWPVRPR